MIDGAARVGKLAERLMNGFGLFTKVVNKGLGIFHLSIVKRSIKYGYARVSTGDSDLRGRLVKAPEPTESGLPGGGNGVDQNGRNLRIHPALGSDLCVIISRRSVRLASFIESSLTVVRPTAVRPSMVGPRNRKWSSQRSRRGSNNGTISPVIGSIPVRFGPFRRLHR